MQCPIWLFRGTDEESDIASNLEEEDILKYKSSVREFEIVDFKDSGHMILDEELGKATKHIRQILDKIDSICEDRHA